MTSKTFFAATLAFAAMTAFTPAFASAAPAADEADVSATVVRTADLNLASDEGMSTLKARIAGAVNQVCGTSAGTMTVQERLAINACRAKARNAALAAARSRNDQMLAQR
ncbi:MAG: UrcA family protein [Novosphingobium sp.]|nr:UrcA family protein [Novosphingobium sp.]